MINENDPIKVNKKNLKIYQFVSASKIRKVSCSLFIIDYFFRFLDSVECAGHIHKI